MPGIPEFLSGYTCTRVPDPVGTTTAITRVGGIPSRVTVELVLLYPGTRVPGYSTAPGYRGTGVPGTVTGIKDPVDCDRSMHTRYPGTPPGTRGKDPDTNCQE
eukprot:999034-Rhodomonas_salina.1